MFSVNIILEITCRITIFLVIEPRLRCTLTHRTRAPIRSFDYQHASGLHFFFWWVGFFERRCRTPSTHGLYTHRCTRIFIDCASRRRVLHSNCKTFNNIPRNTHSAMANYIHVPDEAPAVPKIDVTVDESDYRSGALKLIKELRPSWKPSEVKVKVQFIYFYTF